MIKINNAIDNTRSTLPTSIMLLFTVSPRVRASSSGVTGGGPEDAVLAGRASPAEVDARVSACGIR